MGDQGYGYDVSIMREIASDIKLAKELGVEICLVVGGGNIYRGAYGEKMGMDRSVADYMGMMATIMNATAVPRLKTMLRNTMPITTVYPHTTTTWASALAVR